MKTILNDRKLLLLIVASLFSLSLEVLSLTGIHIQMPYAVVFYSLLVLAVGYKVLFSGLTSLVKLNFSSINLLMLIAVVGAFYLSEYPEAAVVVTLFVLGEYLEDVGVDKSKAALNQLVSQSPKTALVKEANKLTPIEEVTIGTIVLVKPHELVPLDGVIVSGETSIDESTITGEAIPKEKQLGDAVFAGTLNTSGFIELKVSKLASDSTFAKIVELTYEAQENKSESQKFIQRFASYYTPSILAIAILIFVIPGVLLNGNLEHWLLQAITLLVISCPCALVISTPVAIYSALGNASSRGAMVKGGKYIEALASIKAIGLDKTRTITYGTPDVSDIIPLDSYPADQLLSYTASIENLSEHPIAHAIVSYAKQQNIAISNVEKFTSTVGKGAFGYCNDTPIKVGKLSYIEEDLSITEAAKAAEQQLADEGKTSIFVSIGGKLAGAIGVSDSVKPDSLHAINQLKEQEIVPVMLTGDNPKAAQYIAEQVGIQRIHGNLLPQDKASIVDKLLNEYKHIAMVGDGVNDAPALAKATVGIAMGAAGSDTAIEVANIALMNDKLSLIPYLTRLAKATVRTIKVNTIAAISVKAIFIILALAGLGNLVMAIIADVGVTIAVVVVSLRLLTFEGNAPKTTSYTAATKTKGCDCCKR